MPTKVKKCTKDHTYNGWTNYETWNVKLWMDNDQGSYEYWREAAQEAYDSATAERSFTKAERATLDIMQKLKSEHEDAEQDVLERAGVQASMWADLLGAALSEVNWYEIAENLIDDVDKS
jgi:hypothetical protein